MDDAIKQFRALQDTITAQSRVMRELATLPGERMRDLIKQMNAEREALHEIASRPAQRMRDLIEQVDGPLRAIRESTESAAGLAMAEYAKVTAQWEQLMKPLAGIEDPLRELARSIPDEPPGLGELDWALRAPLTVPMFEADDLAATRVHALEERVAELELRTAVAEAEVARLQQELHGDDIKKH